MRTRKFQWLTIAGAVIVVVGLALGLGAGWRPVSRSADANEDATAPSADGSQKRTPVVLTPARQMTFEDRVTASGSVHAKRYALVSARIPGTLDAVFVDEGDAVEAGRTRLFQTDAVKLTKAVAIARQDLTVAECAVQEKQAMLDKNLAAQHQSRNDLERYQELVKRNAIAAQILEKQELHLKECDADVRHTQALIELATAQCEQARLGLTMAEKDLADSLVLSPINGRVSERLREPGEMAGAGTPVLRIEDLSLLEISVFLPEAYYAAVVPGQTEMGVRVGDVDLGLRPVSDKSPTVHAKLRTFKVEGLIESPPAGVVPGCLVEVTIVTDRRRGLGIPLGAVQKRGGNDVVFQVQDGVAHMAAVQKGRQSEGWVEIVSGLSPEAAVVSQGQDLIVEGTPVAIVTEEQQ
jgi:RND family efflux transporter MFP subunit